MMNILKNVQNQEQDLRTLSFDHEQKRVGGKADTFVPHNVTKVSEGRAELFAERKRWVLRGGEKWMLGGGGGGGKKGGGGGATTTPTTEEGELA